MPNQHILPIITQIYDNMENYANYFNIFLNFFSDGDAKREQIEARVGHFSRYQLSKRAECGAGGADIIYKDYPFAT